MGLPKPTNGLCGSARQRGPSRSICRMPDGSHRRRARRVFLHIAALHRAVCGARLVSPFFAAYVLVCRGQRSRAPPYRPGRLFYRRWLSIKRPVESNGPRAPCWRVAEARDRAASAARGAAPIKVPRKTLWARLRRSRSLQTPCAASLPAPWTSRRRAGRPTPRRAKA